MLEIPQIIEELNKNILDNKHNNNIETSLTNIIENAFKKTSQQSSEKLYKNLSKILHPDEYNKTDSYSDKPFMLVLKRKNLVGLPQSVLNKIVNKKRTEHDFETSLTDNPFVYIANMEKKIIEAYFTINAKITEIDAKCQNEYKDFTTLQIIGIARDFIRHTLKEKFPKLYRYEDYPEPIQYLVYGLATIVNIAIILIILNIISIVIIMLIPMILAAIARILGVYLSHNVSNKYYAEEEAILTSMKQELALAGIDPGDFSEEAIKELFDNHMLRTESSRRTYLENNKLLNESDPVEKQELLFRKYYVFKNFNKYAEENPDILKDKDIWPYEITHPEFIQVKNLPDATIQALYNKMESTREKRFSNAHFNNKVNLKPMLHLYLLLQIIYKTILTKDIPLHLCLVQSLIYMFSFLLMLPMAGLYLLKDITLGIIILLKAGSIALINLPLDIWSYFTQPVLLIENKPSDADLLSRYGMYTRILGTDIPQTPTEGPNSAYRAS